MMGSNTKDPPSTEKVDSNSFGFQRPRQIPQKDPIIPDVYPKRAEISSEELITRLFGNNAQEVRDLYNSCKYSRFLVRKVTGAGERLLYGDTMVALCCTNGKILQEAQKPWKDKNNNKYAHRYPLIETPKRERLVFICDIFKVFGNFQIQNRCSVCKNCEYIQPKEEHLPEASEVTNE